MDTSTDTTPDTALTDSDTTAAVVDAYLQTWNETNPDRRSELIASALAADLWYRDPMFEADGLEAYDQMIAGVQAQFPGLVMRRTSVVDAHHDVVRFDWEVGEPGAEPAFAGVDFAKLDEAGKLHRIVGFLPSAVAVS